MSLNIFAGVAKGFALATPRNLKVRPTSVLLRRKLFDSIQDMSEYVFVDLCCGTGSMGLEALSRGVKKLILVDIDTKLAQMNARSMKEKYSIETNVEVVKSDFDKWLVKNERFLLKERPILFFDPPYEKSKLYEYFMQRPLDRLSAISVIEGCEQKTMRIAEFEEIYGPADKKFQQGTSYFLLYRFDVK